MDSVWLRASCVAMVMAGGVARAQPLDRPMHVPMSSNLYAAGRAFVEAPAGGGAGTLPPVRLLPPGVGRRLNFINASGSVSFCPPCGFNGPDGINFGSVCTVSAWRGISAFRATRIRGVMGVFLTDSTPADPPPAALLWDTPAVTGPVIAPGLRQVFFIGDGLTGTGSGSWQEFVVPDGATRMYLGFVDGLCGGSHGTYGDTAGAVSIQPIPTGCLWLEVPPSSSVLCPGVQAVIGAGFLGASDRVVEWHWRRPGEATWNTFANGPLTIDGVVWGEVGQATTPNLLLTVDADGARIAESLEVRAVATAGCGSFASPVVEVSVAQCASAACPGSCLGDYNRSGGIPDLDDVIDFFTDLIEGTACADVNSSGGVPEIDDIVFFFEAFGQECP